MFEFEKCNFILVNAKSLGSRPYVFFISFYLNEKNLSQNMDIMQQTHVKKGFKLQDRTFFTNGLVIL